MGVSMSPVKRNNIASAATLLTSIIVVLLASAAYAKELPVTACEPSWARACAPTTSGTVPLEGVVDARRNFPYSSIDLMYRTTEGSLGPNVGKAEYGPWRAISVNSTGGFLLPLPACPIQARFSGCVGGSYEIYATYRGQPCTEMWYASLFVGEPDRLPENGLNCLHTTNSISPLTGGALEPRCEPYWARNCLPGTQGTTSVTGVIGRPEAYIGPFSLSHVTLAYRTNEASTSGAPIYGNTHYVNVGNNGAFSMTPRGCGISALALGGCAGGVIEAWPAYNHVKCGRAPVGLLIAGEPQQLGTNICDTRGSLEGNFHAAKHLTWQVIARQGKRVYRAGIKSDDTYSLLLPPGKYRVTARSGRRHCATSHQVIIGIVKKTNLTIQC